MSAPAPAAASRSRREEVAAAHSSLHQLQVSLWAKGLRQSHQEGTTTVPDAWVLATAAAAAAALATLGPAPRADGPAPADLSQGVGGGEAQAGERVPDVSAVAC